MTPPQSGGYMVFVRGNFIRFLVVSVLSLCFIAAIPNTAAKADISDYIAFVILSEDSLEMNIGDEIRLRATTSTLKKTQWKSSDSKIASVDANGVVTAKKAGTVKITAKIKNADASCRIKVRKTELSLNKRSISLERGETFKLVCETSNGSVPVYKINRKSIATVDENGLVTALKPGEATITVKADGYSVTCSVKVKKPTIKLSRSSVQLFKGESEVISAQVSSGVSPTWKSNRSSVAVIDENGRITAIKNGYAIITATVDGVKKICEVTVKKPKITLSKTELELFVGDSCAVTAKIDSGASPEWTSSNESVAEVDSSGRITARKKGKAYIYAIQDGTKVKCSVTVKEKK